MGPPDGRSARPRAGSSASKNIAAVNGEGFEDSAEQHQGQATAVGRDFDWRDDDVIVPQQLAIAVYRNPAGDIVLRQCSDGFYDDAFSWFHPKHAQAVAAAILDAIDRDIERDSHAVTA